MFANRSFRTSAELVVAGRRRAGLAGGDARSCRSRRDWPLAAILPLTLLFGAAGGRGDPRSRQRARSRAGGVLGRGAVAVLVGVVVGELAARRAVLRLDRPPHRRAGRSCRRLHARCRAGLGDLDRSARPAPHSTTRSMRRAFTATRRWSSRAANSIPSPACPQTRITGVPGAGPETRTANELLADTQRELDNAIAARDRLAPGLDAEIAAREQTRRRKPAKPRSRRRGPRPGCPLGRHARPHVVRRGRDRAVGPHDRLLRAAEPAAADAATVSRPDDRRAQRWPPTPSAIAPSSTPTPRSRSSVPRCARRSTTCGPSNSSPVPGSPSRPRTRSTASCTAAESSRLSMHPCRPSDCQRAAEPESREEDMYLPIAAEAEAASLAAPSIDRICRRASSRSTTTRTQTPSLIPNVTKTAARWIRPLRAADCGPRDRHHHASVAHRAPGVRRGRGDHVFVEAHPQGDGQLRGEHRADRSARTVSSEPWQETHAGPVVRVRRSSRHGLARRDGTSNWTIGTAGAELRRDNRRETTPRRQ